MNFLSEGFSCCSLNVTALLKCGSGLFSLPGAMLLSDNILVMGEWLCSGLACFICCLAKSSSKFRFIALHMSYTVA